MTSLSPLGRARLARGTSLLGWGWFLAWFALGACVPSEAGEKPTLGVSATHGSGSASSAPARPSVLPAVPEIGDGSCPPPAPAAEAAPASSSTAAEYPFQAPLLGPEFAARDRPARHANWSRAECAKKLAQHKLSMAHDSRPSPGMVMAVRLRGPVGGVTFVAPPRRSPFGALDCRLALALTDLAPILTEHGVSEMRIDNLYRPPSRRSRRPRHSQHTRGLAADITAFKLRDGRTLVVERDWQGTLGAPVCGPEARVREPSDAAIRLRNLVCAVAARQLFDTMLTPNYDTAHHDHLHWDLRRGARSVILR